MQKIYICLLLIVFIKKWEVFNSVNIKKVEYYYLFGSLNKTKNKYSLRKKENLFFFFNKNQNNNYNNNNYNSINKDNHIFSKIKKKLNLNKKKILSLKSINLSSKLKKNNQLKKKKNAHFSFIWNNIASYIKNKDDQKKKKCFLYNNEEPQLDPELYESLGGCLENDMKNNYFDTLIDCSEDDYNYDEEEFDTDDLSEETKRKKYYTYGRPFNDKDFNSEYVQKYYQHLPKYFENDNICSNKNFKKVYESNKIENLERNIREEDLYYPSVPINWKTYVCLFFDKKYNYENSSDKKIYDKFNRNIRHKFVMEFLSWVKLSTRIYQNTSKMLMLFNLKRNNNIYGNLFFFTSLNLHYAHLFMKSNPYVKLGLCEELYLYSYEGNNDHFLIGNFPNLFIETNYLLIKFFRPNKLKDINDLYEKHMRFYITSNMIFKLGVLKKVRKDNLKDLFLTPYQYLPITEEQTKKILNKFDNEFKIFEKCNSIEINKNYEIEKVEYDNNEEVKDNKHKKKKKYKKSELNKNEENEDTNDRYAERNYKKYTKNCLAELSIINCKSKEDAIEFLEKDPYTRCCFYDSIFFSEVAEVSPHVQYSEGYMPKIHSKLNYKYELDTNLNPSECLQDRPEFLENKSLKEKKLKSFEKVDFDLIDTFIKMKYTNKEVEYENYDIKENDIGIEANIKNEKDIKIKKKDDFLQKNQENNDEIFNEKYQRESQNNSIINKEYKKINEASNFLENNMVKKKYKKYKVKIVDYNNDYIDYICNVQRNKILYVKKKKKDNSIDKESKNEQSSNSIFNIFDILSKDMRNPNINKEKDIILIDNTLQFFDHIFFKDYLADFVYISLPPGEYIEDPYSIKDEKNYDFTIFNNSLATEDDFLKRRNFQPRFLKGIWLKKKHSKILFYDKQNNALLFGTGIDKTFSWNKKVDDKIMKRALLNMEIAYEKIRKGSSMLQNEVTIHQESDRTIKEYTDEYTSFQNRFTSVHNHLNSSEGYKDLKPPPGLEYLNPHIWEKTSDEHKKLILDTDKVQKIHSNFLKKVELYKASIDDDPFVQKVPSENDILSYSDKVDIEII
ncbi:conserved Plasmodium protein, unknown function [Plasmodium gallinaceum]|uniref:Uncharacterized protein n=1 Tax=Plasmodium gallinaceum TaxID=5849 RepID=A0A1J1GQM7_PLAGA|nr:conserved Plasmodium protein, unknown function [Plasmodium gallinaceum]CRG93591.1 conserved Plasmodium protein, unknown function [Plasmodium gallinaceum]